jgi:hypothetical protein
VTNQDFQRYAIAEAMDALWREISMFHGHEAARTDSRIVSLSQLLGVHNFGVAVYAHGVYTPTCSCGHSFRTYRTNRGAMNAARKHVGLAPVEAPSTQLALQAPTKGRRNANNRQE